MKISRLFGIVHLLIEKKCVTAKELAARFEVSVRTIYRDVEVLSEAGIPVYATQGKAGGICILDQFVLNKAVFSEDEQAQILMALQSLGATRQPDVDSALLKLGGLFQKTDANWIEVDFSGWAQSEEEKAVFETLKQAIMSRNAVTFMYSSGKGEITQREAEPLKLAFKRQSWYLYAHCRLRQDSRFFKLSRIKNLVLLDEHFDRTAPAVLFSQSEYIAGPEVTLVMRFDASVAFRVFDEFPNAAKQQADGSLIVRQKVTHDTWLIGYILSFGESAEVLEPADIREAVKKNLELLCARYQT